MTDSTVETPRPSVMGVVVHILSSGLVVLAAAWSLNLARMIGTAFYTGQFLGAILGTSLGLAFLVLPASGVGKRQGAVPWWDVALAAIGFVTGWWMAYRYPALIDIVLLRPPEAVAIGVVLILLTLEALRRSTGWALVIIVGAFFLYGLFAEWAPGRLAGRGQDWDKLSAYLAFDVNGIAGLPLGIAATVVVAFIFFGNLLGATGGSSFFTDAAIVAMGRFRGGSMKIAVLASALFGSISGSAVANVVATGVVTIPLIKRAGYPAHKAGAIEAVASTGGQLMPPVMGAAAFLMAEFLQVPYAEVVLAATLPGLLYYFALFIQADLEAARLGIAPVDRSEVPPLRQTLKGFYFLVPFVVLILALFSWNWQAEKAALLAALAVVALAFVFGYEGRRPTPMVLLRALSTTGVGVLDIILISAAAGVIIGVLNITGLGFNLTYLLVKIGAGSAITLLVLSAIVCIILGMGLPTLGVYVLLAALVAPALVEVGIEPMAAHLYVLYFGMMSMITPPVAIAAFAAAGIAGASAMRTGFEAVRFGWPAFIVPFLFVYSPSLIMIGETHEIVLAGVTAALGVWLISAALIGYLIGELSWKMRIAMGVAGLLSLIPAGMFPGAIYTDIVGVILGLILVGVEFARSRRPALEAKKAAS